jgi:hypothetical protein
MTSPLPDTGRLVEAIQNWLHEASRGDHGGLDTGAPECGVCPLCRAAGLLRSADPAVVTVVVEAVVGAAVAAADVLREAGDRLLATDASDVAASTATPPSADVDVDVDLGSSAKAPSAERSAS